MRDIATGARLTLDKYEWHRNGVGGEGFYVVLFRADERNMMAVVFPLEVDDDGQPTQTWNGRVSVFDRDMLAAGNITFGENSWRGDNYEGWLRSQLPRD